jgi:hypothetical protein
MRSYHQHMYSFQTMFVTNHSTNKISHHILVPSLPTNIVRKTFDTNIQYTRIYSCPAPPPNQTKLLYNLFFGDDPWATTSQWSRTIRHFDTTSSFKILSNYISPRISYTSTFTKFIVDVELLTLQTSTNNNLVIL